MFEENTDKPYISDTNKPLFWCNREYNITSCYIPFDDYLYEARFWAVPMIKKQSTTWKPMWNRNAGGCINPFPGFEKEYNTQQEHTSH